MDASSGEASAALSRPSLEGQEALRQAGPCEEATSSVGRSGPLEDALAGAVVVAVVEEPMGMGLVPEVEGPAATDVAEPGAETPGLDVATVPVP